MEDASTDSLDRVVYPQTFEELSSSIIDEDSLSCGECSVETYWSTDLLSTIIEETEEDVLLEMYPHRPRKSIDTDNEGPIGMLHLSKTCSAVGSSLSLDFSDRDLNEQLSDSFEANEFRKQEHLALNTQVSFTIPSKVPDPLATSQSGTDATESVISDDDCIGASGEICDGLFFVDSADVNTNELTWRNQRIDNMQQEQELRSFSSDDEYTFVTYVTGDEISIDSSFPHAIESENDLLSPTGTDFECSNVLKQSIDYQKMRRRLAFEICRSRAKNHIEKSFKLSSQKNEFVGSTLSSTGHDEGFNQLMRLALEQYGGLRRRKSYEQSKIFLQEAFGRRKNRPFDRYIEERETLSERSGLEFPPRQESFQKRIEKFRQKYEEEVKPLLMLDSDAKAEKKETRADLRIPKRCFSLERTKNSDGSTREGSKIDSKIDSKLSKCRLRGRIAQERLKNAFQEYRRSSMESNEDVDKLLSGYQSFSKIMKTLEESPKLRHVSPRLNSSRRKLQDAFQNKQQNPLNEIPSL